jgi:tetratricopeptide (TPR) repeat protein
MEVEPKLYRAIMVSSTFTDLEEHRSEAIDAINRFGFYPNVMEYSGARTDADVIETSLRMVRDSAAYLCVIGHKYGQTPLDADRNPQGLSITELEFNEARKLGRPILLFLMSDDHPVTKGDIEQDTKKQKKLEAFRKQAKRVNPGKATERVYETFKSKDEFAKKAAIAVGLEAIQTAGKSGLPDRAIRDAITRFIDVKPEANQAELTDAIERFEAGYRALEQQLAAITVTDNRVTSLKAAAEAALAEGDLDKARAAYREAAEAARDKAAEPVRTAAELKSAEAGAHLLALDWEAADIVWTEAAAMLAPFDSDAADELTENASERLEKHGELYARAGALGAAINRLRALVASAEAQGDDREAARLRNNLGTALKTQGERIGGSEGLGLLDEAVMAFRRALTIHTRVETPVSWATIQNNLGAVLATQGQRTDNSAGLRLLDEAVTAYRDVLTVHSRAEMPVEWARAQNNLGIALKSQGARTGGPEGLRLLDEAVTAFRDALTIRTRADAITEWATTQINLGNALQTQGECIRGPEGLRLLDEAVTVYRNALSVHTRAGMPAIWALTQGNIGRALACMAEVDSGHASDHLRGADAALVAALSVFSPEHTAFYHDEVTDLLAYVRARLEALDT